MVTFETYGGALIEDARADPGQTITRPADPKKTYSPFQEKDITLIGWYVDEDFSKEFDFSATIANDLKLYARYRYHITTEAQLRAIDKNLKGSYQLEADIDLKGTNWTPIGNRAIPFTGHFNGQGHVIKDLNINTDNSERNIGLFGIVGEGGVVQAVGIDVGEITGGWDVGALAGLNEGAVSGYAKGGSVQGINNVGGLVGSNAGVITGYATVNVSASANTAGGLVGYNSGAVTGYATGDVVGLNSIRGLVGVNYGATTGYALGAVSNRGTHILNGEGGGLIGSFGDGVATGYARGNITRVRKFQTTFGLLVGSAGAGYMVTGYRSGKTGESQLNGFEAQEERGGVDGAAAIDYSANPTPTQASFSGFTFGPDTGQWACVEGRWPAIRLPVEVGARRSAYPAIVGPYRRIGLKNRKAATRIGAAFLFVAHLNRRLAQQTKRRFLSSL